jgi:hypothetical protein
MELSYILKKIDAGEPPEEIVLDGHDRDMLKAAHTTRLKIVDWYRKRLNYPVPQLGNYIEGPDARPWVRGDLLAAEMVRHGKDVPESGIGRENIILRYLLNMSERSTWGSTPEYFAAACMTGKKIHVRQMNEKGELFIINSVDGSCIPPPVIIDGVDPQPQAVVAAVAALDAVSAIAEVSSSAVHGQAALQLTVEADFQPEVISTAIVLAPEIGSPPSSPSVSSATATKLQDSEMDADLYSETGTVGDMSESDVESEDGEDGEDDDEDDDGSYNLFFRNNHYQALVSRSQYLRLVSQYGIDAFRNFRGI